MAGSPLPLDAGLHRSVLNAKFSLVSIARDTQTHETSCSGVLRLEAGKVWCGMCPTSSEDDGSFPAQLHKLHERQFLDTALWWDTRRYKPTVWLPDFTHEKSKVVLWFYNLHKAAWVDLQLAKWDAGSKGSPGPVSSSVQGPKDSVASEDHLDVRICRKLCEDGRTTDAVDTLQHFMQQGGHVPKNLFYRVLKRCLADKDLIVGRRIHTLAVEGGYEGDAFLATQFIGVYASHGMLDDALGVFSKVSRPNAFNWAAIISAYARCSQAAQAISLYRQMRESSVRPDNRIYSAALKACAIAGDLVAGKEIHSHILQSPDQADTFVHNGLLDMYVKCRSLDDARKVFDKIQDKDVVTWTAMIAGYAQGRMGQEALDLYKGMQHEGLCPPNSVTFLCLLQACASVGVGGLHSGKQLHLQIESKGLESDVALGGSLVNMYAKCGSLVDAREVFDRLPDRNVMTWNAMLGGYAQQGMGQEALDLYNIMQHERLSSLDSVTFTCLLQACACVGTGALHQGLLLHSQIEDRGLQHDVVLGGSLVNMYAKCSGVKEARNVFDKLPNRNVVTWNVMIAAYVQQGMGHEALCLYKHMQQEGLNSASSVTFGCLLQACANIGISALHEGRQLHSKIKEQGLENDVVLGCSLVNMYAKCGSVGNARNIFDTLQHKNVVTWTTIIAGYVSQGMGEEALILYSRMRHEGHSFPDSVTFVCLLQACAYAGVGALHQGKQLHTQIEEQGLRNDLSLGGSLVSMYIKCGSLDDARGVFDRLLDRSVVTWNAMFAGYAQQGLGQEALNLYKTMHREGRCCPDSVSFVCLLQACSIVGAGALHDGKQLHAQAVEQGLENDVDVGGSLVNMYAKCGTVEDARGVFDSLSHRNVLTWTAMIGCYAQQGMGVEALVIYNCMMQEGLSVPDSVTLTCLLQACASVGVGALRQGKLLHAQIKQQGLQHDSVLGSSLVHMYVKCGTVEDARTVFAELVDKNVVTWTAMIAGYAQQGMGSEALSLYSHMQQEGLSAPDAVTFICLLQACADVGGGALQQGKQLHSQIEARGLQQDMVVGGSLVNMYTKCGPIEEAQGVFDRIPNRSVVTWNAMLAGYAQQGMGREALSLYDCMQQDGLSPNPVTFTCILQACSSVGEGALHIGKQLHAQIEEQGLQNDVVLGGSLVNMYVKCGSVEDARSVFDSLRDRNVITWTAMIAGYAQQGNIQEALRLYSKMQQECLCPPNPVTFVCLLQACANVACLPLGIQLHAEIEERELQVDVVVGGALVNMYAKCGSMFDAQRVFDSLSERTIEAWTALIGGYSRQGESKLVFDLIDRMRSEGMKPNGITFLSVLTVCSHGGLVDEGRKYFDTMKLDYGICPTAEHYTCMMDLLGRAGHLEEAIQMTKTMPVPATRSVWHTLLSACQKWNNVEIGQQAFEFAVRLDEKDAASYVLMSNIYSRAQRWEEAEDMHARRVKCGAWKEAGQSWWTDVDGVVHTFVVGDEKRYETHGIYEMLEQAVASMQQDAGVTKCHDGVTKTEHHEKEPVSCAVVTNTANQSTTHNKSTPFH